METLALGTALFFTTGNIINQNKESKSNNLDNKKKFILNLRNPKSYSKSIRKIIDLITIENDVYPVGSQKYKIHGYPSDIDLMEKVKVCCDLVDTISYVSRHLKRIAKRIKKTDRIYLGDFKAGIDDRFNRNIGWINLSNKLVGYDYKDVKTILEDARDFGEYKTIKNIKELEYIDEPIFQDFFNSLRNKYILVNRNKVKLGDWYDKNKSKNWEKSSNNWKFWEKYLESIPKQFEWHDKDVQYFNILHKTTTSGLITNEEYEHLLSLLPKDSSNITQWEHFQSEYRKYYIFRWDIDEIIEGKKVINRKNTSMTVDLSQSLLHESIVKLDVWAKINGNYIELTNYFLLMYLDKKGMPKYVNTPMGDYVQKLLWDINHYFNSPHPKYMKATKRIWSVAVHQNDVNMLNNLYKLFSSDASILYQISAEIETIVDMMNNLSHPPFDEIIDQIERFKSRINVVYNIPSFTKKEEDEVYQFIDEIVDIFNKNKKMIYKSNDNKYSKKIVNILELIMMKLDKNVNKYTETYLKVNKIKKNVYQNLKDKKLVLTKPKTDKTGFTINPDLTYDLDWNKNPEIGIEKRKAIMKKPGQSFKIIEK